MRKSKLSMLALSTLMILGGANAFAQQRSVDLEPVMDSPASGTTITSGDQVQLQVTLKNNGTDGMVTGDSIFYTITGDPANAVHFDTLRQDIPAGQSAVVIATSVTLTIQGSDPVTGDFCVTILDPEKAGVTMNQVPVVVSYSDQDTSNNAACNNITINPAGSEPPSAIAEVSGNGAPLSLYPNPAHSDVNFNINLEKAGNVTAVVRDITGRVVLNHAFGTVPAGNNVPLKLNVSDFVSGMYIIELHAGDKEYIGKVSVRN